MLHCSPRSYLLTALLLTLSNLLFANESKFSEPKRVNSQLVPNGSVSFFRIIPETSSLVYLADQEEDERLGIYVADLNSTINPLRLNNTLLSREVDTSNIEVTSNGLFATATIDDPGTGGQSTFSVPLLGTPLAGIAVSLNLNGFDRGAFDDEADGDIQISADGKFAVYRYDSDDNGLSELYSLRFKPGKQPKRISEPMVTGGEVRNFKISPDSKTVVYAADQNSDQVFELFSVPTGGGTVISLSPNQMAFADIVDFDIAPNSQHVVYIADRDKDNVRELYSNQISGGTPLKLSAPVAIPGARVLSFEISPLNNAVAYRADQTVDQQIDLYLTGLDSNNVTRINDAIAVASGDIFDFRFLPSGTHVVYRGDLLVNNKLELFSKALNQGAQLRISGEREDFAVVEEYQLSNDGSYAIVRGAFDTLGQQELFRVSTTQASTRVKLSPPLTEFGDVGSNFKISPDNTHVIFEADTRDTFRSDLYAADIYTGKNHLLTPSTLSQLQVEDITLSKSGKHILFLHDQEVSNQRELFVVHQQSTLRDELCFPISTKNNKVAVICL